MILVVSKDEDFSSVIAELLQQELQYPCKIAKSAEEAKTFLPGKIELVVTSEMAGKWPVPSISLPRTDGPFKLQKLLGDISALLQKSEIHGTIAIGSYEFQPMAKRLSHGVKNVSLTDKETQLLLHMLEAGPKGAAKDALLKDVWGFETDMDTHTLETHIYRLRAKFRELGEEQTIVATENGYTLGIKE